MYRFALRPAWLLSHVFAASLVILFITLGFWQLQRHEQRSDRNETVTERTAEPSAPLDELLAGTDDVDDLRYRSTTVSGTYEAGAGVLIDNRSHDGLPGAWIVTPLRLDDGSVVAVNRGFQGFDSGTIDPPAPPEGRVAIEATVLPWVERDCGIRTDDTGEPVGAACLNREAVEGAVGESVLPVVLQRVSSTPADADVLVAVPLPELDAGPHRSYAVQWFIFATIGLGGYPLILRRVARDRARAEQADRGPGDHDPTDHDPTGEEHDLDAELATLLADGGPDQARS